MYDDRKSIVHVAMKKLAAIFFLANIYCSCSHYYYVPNVQNVPLFRDWNAEYSSARARLIESLLVFQNTYL
jgi:hypothetical protein